MVNLIRIEFVGGKRVITLDKIYNAAFVLKNVVRKTDMIHAFNFNCDGDIYLKTENLQNTGSFKIRGAYYKMSRLTPEEKEKGIIASSAGNHAQGVALAAARNNIPCTICMPDGAPISKVEATKSYGANVCLVKGAYDDAYTYARKLQEEKGYTFLHPFDDVDVIAGQGTIGLEVLEQVQDVDAVIVPVGGGGLISGVAYAIKKLKPECKVYGVQANGAPSMVKSVECKKHTVLESVSTFADGIAVKRPGDLTYELVGKYVDDITTVTDDEIAAAVLALIEKQKLITEGAGAIAFAAAMFNKFELKGKKTVCLLSGGNIDVNILSRVITRGLIMSGRSSTLTIALEDKPGQLLGVSEVISKCGGNVVSVHYNQGDKDTSITSCCLTVGLETRDFEQIEQIKKELTKAGFKIL